MLMQQQREEIAYYGRKMLHDGLTRNTGGYLSAYDREAKLIAVSPSGMPYDDIRPEDVVVVDLAGNVLEGTGRPSTEWLVPRTVFPVREDIDAIVHTHSTFATVMSALRWEVPAANFTLALAGGNVRCTEFYNYTSQALADAILEKMEGRTAVLMGNHGLVGAGKSVKQAYTVAEEIEFCCEVYLRAKSAGGTVVPLSDAQLVEMVQALGGYYHKKK